VVGVVLWVGACMSPRPAIGEPSALAPVVPTPRAVALVARPTQPPAPTAAPVLVPTVPPIPAPSPPPTAATGALLAGIRGDLSAQWLKNHAESALRGGPDDAAPLFTLVPQWSTLKRLGSRGDWLKVYYAGDGDTRQPGPGWVRAADVGAVGAPPVWIASTSPTALWADATSRSRTADVAAGKVWMEVLPGEPVAGTRIHVRTPGDGRSTPPAQGWVEAADVARIDPPGLGALPWAFPADLNAQVRILVPYWTQLDGSDYATANCGPTTLGMALESLGVRLDPRSVRSEVLVAQDDVASDDGSGSYIWALARVARDHSARVLGLYEDDGVTLHHWTVDDVRRQVAAGHPVIAQVRYRLLPRRGDSGYYEDHYVVVTGLVGDNVLYNDPIGGPSAGEGPGWDRVMTADELGRAMNASDSRFAYAAFAVAR